MLDVAGTHCSGCCLQNSLIKTKHLSGSELSRGAGYLTTRLTSLPYVFHIFDNELGKPRLAAIVVTIV